MTGGTNYMANLENPSETRGRLIAAGKVSGTTVYNTSGEKLGYVYDILLDKMSGKADYAILSFGGFLGIGDKYHPLPWYELKYDTLVNGYVVDLDRERLEGAPSYGPSDVGLLDDARVRDIDTYYGPRSETIIV